jgi:hypothetical protein
VKWWICIDAVLCNVHMILKLPHEKGKNGRQKTKARWCLFPNMHKVWLSRCCVNVSLYSVWLITSLHGFLNSLGVLVSISRNKPKPTNVKMFTSLIWSNQLCIRSDENDQLGHLCFFMLAIWWFYILISEANRDLCIGRRDG